MNISIVIPTYQREQVLIQTLEALLPQLVSGDELIVIDQTLVHLRVTEQALQHMHDSGEIIWIRQLPPSIPCAMNRGLTQATREIVLFLDDDIEPSPSLIASHRRAHQELPNIGAIVGQVLQPGENSGPRKLPRRSRGLNADMNFPFWSDQRTIIQNVMAGNLSVRKELALAIGGFDERFQGVAYRFETEFARRLIQSGHSVSFEPEASIRHLRAASGGTRAKGSHLTSASPVYGMGDYYFAMRHGRFVEACCYMLRRPIREVTTRFHLKRPWYIPIKLLGEVRAFLAAFFAWRNGPKLIPPESTAVFHSKQASSKVFSGFDWKE